jgi:ligand-binding SRPBCC domain-containing protein
MFSVKDEIHIVAPVERVFLLSTSVEVVRLTLGMRPVGGSGGWRAGPAAGLVVAGDTVEWRGWKFGLPQVHVSVISGYRAPEFFQDTQLRGRFAAFQHDHHFEAAEGGTALWDEVRFSLPFGVLGRVVGERVMVPHVAGLLRARFALLKGLAEGEGWRRYVGE